MRFPPPPVRSIFRAAPIQDVSLRITLRPLALLTLLMIPAARLEAQSFTWKSLVTFYGDNTEFFNPYRTGETILGGQFQTWLSIEPGRRTEVIAGVFGDHRSGDDSFLDPVKPLLGFRYHTDHSLGALGTLVTENRHGYLEPLEVTTLEFTRPIEYGIQWRERRGWLDGELYLNWQHLNTPDSREIFDYGLNLAVRPIRQVSLEYQSHGLHHGGQLYDVGPVTNNFASGIGLGLTERFRWIDSTSLRLFYLHSHGNIDSIVPAGRPDQGHGTYLRLGITPGNWCDLWMIQWWGKDYLAQEGDNNYNSVGSDPSYYKSDRRYQEYGFGKSVLIDHAVTARGELRFHRIDDLSSISIGTSKWEYSYRITAVIPIGVRISH